MSFDFTKTRYDLSDFAYSRAPRRRCLNRKLQQGQYNFDFGCDGMAGEREPEQVDSRAIVHNVDVQNGKCTTRMLPRLGETSSALPDGEHTHREWGCQRRMDGTDVQNNVGGG
jgi:hypothetical protein